MRINFTLVIVWVVGVLGVHSDGSRMTATATGDSMIWMSMTDQIIYHGPKCNCFIFRIMYIWRCSLAAHSSNRKIQTRHNWTHVDTVPETNIIDSRTRCTMFNWADAIFLTSLDFIGNDTIQFATENSSKTILQFEYAIFIWLPISTLNWLHAELTMENIYYFSHPYSSCGHKYIRRGVEWINLSHFASDFEKKNQNGNINFKWHRK